jgi:hypothetical protein
MLIPLLGKIATDTLKANCQNCQLRVTYEETLGGDRLHFSGIETEIDFQLNTPSALRRNRMVSAELC